MGGRAEDALMRNWRRVAEVLLLAVVIGVAVYVRFDRLSLPSFWLDEILGQQLTAAAASQPWWRWITGFDPEHGPLYHLTQLLFPGRMGAALFGLLTVPVVWLVARRRFGAVAAAAAAILLAVSPLHVYYSREARPYALLMLSTALAIAWWGRRSTFFLLLAMLYTSAVAAAVVASVFLVSGISALVKRDRMYAAIAAFAALTLALFPLIYASRPAGDPNWPRFPPLDFAFFTSLARTFSVSALGTPIAGRTAVAMLLFAIVGAMVVARKKDFVLLGMTVFPFAIALFALRLFDHFYAARYVLPALIGFLVLAAVGIVTAARLLGERVGAVLAIAVAIVVVTQGWTSARTEAFRKLDWRGIAATIAHYARPNDIILAAEPWTEVSLRHYLDQHPRAPRLVQMPHVALADQIRRGEPAAWLVTAGFEDSPMRRWMCGFPLVLARPLENFRLHYASPSSDFLRERGTPAELRALNAALGERGFALRTDETRFFGDGWAQPEETFRWAVGTRATITIPRWGVREQNIRVRVLPFDHPSLPPQTMRVTLNGTLLGERTLPADWSEQTFAAKAWKDGWNEVTFTFARANAPAALDARSQDRRELAVSFDWIAIGDAAEPSRPAEYVTRIAVMWGGPPAGSPPPIALRALYGRLGLDPDSAGAVPLAAAAETIAYGQDCEDGATFLRRAFLILLERPPNEVEQRDLLGRMRRGASREHIVQRILKADDFKAARAAAPDRP